MTVQEIANKTVEYNRSGNHDGAYAELYDAGCVSIENWGGERTEYVGMDAIGAKAKGWCESVTEIHEVRVSEPLVSDSSFAVTYFMDITYKDSGRQTMTELAVYTVKDGKIVSEEFKA
jgi:hypothetical protein